MRDTYLILFIEYQHLIINRIRNQYAWSNQIQKKRLPEEGKMLNDFTGNNTNFTIN